MAAGIVSWAQARRSGALARAYAAAARELTVIRTEAEACSESRWPRYVDEAEGAISREHRLWRAIRDVRPAT